MCAAASGKFTEPEVLAQTKRHLFSAGADEYVVTDTQFAQDSWIDGEPIDERIHETLAPYNHLALGSGYPDLVGVTAVDEAAVDIDTPVDEPPVIAVEAKGETRRDAGHRDAAAVAIRQAYDRLTDANVVYVALPDRYVSRSVCTQARELNVGVLAVDPAGAVRTAVRPRLVGSQNTDAERLLRFQASEQGLAEKSFGLNHPKNYLGYTLALAHPKDTQAVTEERVVGAVSDAETGARFLGLVERTPTSEGLQHTSLGREVLRFAREREGSLEDAFDRFDDWRRRRTCFYDLAPLWGELTRRILWDYPLTELLVEQLQRLNQSSSGPATLPDFVTHLYQTHPEVTTELFFKSDHETRQRVFAEENELRQSVLQDSTIYHSPTVFQLKAMLYHAGILTERGAEPSRLTPEEDVWSLRQSQRTIDTGN
jgi:hypothetical protein